jgi:hypothetical protein
LYLFQKMRRNRVLVGTRIQENKNFLNAIIKTASEKRRYNILKGATAEELLSLVEICHNILRSRFHLTARQKTRLAPHAVFIRKLGGARREHTARTLIQKGAGFPYRTLVRPILLEASRQVAQSQLPTTDKK